MLIVAGAALALTILMACFRCLQYPHVKLTIFNETSAAICDVRVRFLYGERTADRIEPGGFAATEIQSGGDAGVFLSYRDSAGNLKKDEPVYYSDERGCLDRGFLEVHVTDNGQWLANRIYTFFDLLILTRHVAPTGRMAVRSGRHRTIDRVGRPNPSITKASSRFHR